MLVSGLLLLGYDYLITKNRYQYRLSALYPIFIFGFFAIYVTNAAEIWGLQYMSSAKACLIYSLSPFAAALLAIPILKEKITQKKWWGLAIGFLGLMPLLFAESQPIEIFNELKLVGWADSALVIAVFASAYGWILLKKILTQYVFSTVFVNGLAMLTGGTLALAHSYLSGESWTPFPVSQNGWLVYLECMVWMTLISNIICYNLYGHLLKKFTATFMSFAGLVTPLFASLFGWFFLDEVITWHFYFAMGLFSIGLTLFYIDELPGFSIYKENQVSNIN